jgi:hypothetical protein
MRQPLTLLVAATLAACQATPQASSGVQLLGWSEASHGKGAPPDYGVVFPQGRVAEFKITVAPADWAKMLDDMARNYGPRGTGRGGPGGPRPDFGASGPAFPGMRPDMGASGPAFPGGPGGPGGTGSKAKPIWVPATITYDGRTWSNVGFRFKGNSSLSSAWQGGTDKLPFKLVFDKLEDEHPEIKDQRFYGFKQLALSTNWNDPTAMRDALSYGLLAEAGLPAARTAFYQVTLDHGAGDAGLGLYTAVEVIDDTVVPRVFGSKDGNIYEGDGAAASLAAGTRDQIPDGFQKENNDKSDWADVQALYDALHAETRTSDAAAWRAGLEKVFDPDGFLRWLALAAALQHWDTYGGMTHNFYLYHDPKAGRLEWISWDHNLVLGAQGGPGGPGGPGGAGGARPDVAASGAAFPGGPGGGLGRSSLDKAEVGSNWPLIRFLMDDPTYHARYVAALRELQAGPFDQARLLARYQAYAAILRPAADAGFDAGLQALIDATTKQEAAIKTYLSTQP